MSELFEITVGEKRAVVTHMPNVFFFFCLHVINSDYAVQHIKNY